MGKVSKPKYILFGMVIGAGIGVLNLVIQKALSMFSISLPTGFVGGGTLAAGMAIALLLINRSIERGGCQWLLKHEHMRIEN